MRVKSKKRGRGVAERESGGVCVGEGVRAGSEM